MASREQLAAFAQRLRANRSRASSTSLPAVLALVGIPVIVLALASFLILHFLQPLPPRNLRIATGSARGAYAQYAARYRPVFKRAGITLDILASEGAADNLDMLHTLPAKADAAMLQDGVATPDDPAMRSLGAIGYEPIWVFYRARQPWSRMSDLAGKRINIGRWGAGTQLFAVELLREAGLTQDVEGTKSHARNVQLSMLSSAEALDALRQGQLDAVITLGEPASPTIQAYFHSPGVRALNLTQADAIARHRPFFHRITIPRGGIDLRADLPDEDLQLVATTSVIYVRADIHPALVTLLSQAMAETHRDPGLLNAKHEFPSDQDQTIPLHPQAERYLKNGQPLLTRYLPFWLATLLDRTFVVVLPLLALLIPAFRVIPQLYNWRIRRRLDRWYAELKFLESELDRDDLDTERNLLLDRLAWIEQQLGQLKLPLGFSNQLYILREHIELVRRRVLRMTARGVVPVTAAATATATAAATASATAAAAIAATAADATAADENGPVTAASGD